ncbi:unnamed protein product [marine sediment metagenome]|uniref:Uncharacterized protein n=1 Tax=marine sediment metagenome TaxID=412755 RepID=X1SES4_9ZZZZ
MKLSKAIKDLQARVDGEFAIKGKDDCEDLKLAIEAMKAIQRHRHTNMPAAFIVLKGETPEEESKRS